MTTDCNKRLHRPGSDDSTSGCRSQCARSFVMRVFPFLSILQGYSLRADLPRDLVAGLTVGVMHVPQGMAYALLADLAPVYGLYTSFFPSLVYFFFGTSRQVSVGTFGVLSLMIGEVVREGVAAWEQENRSPSCLLTNASNVATANETRDNKEEVEHVKLVYAMSVTFAVGLVQVLLGVMRVGRVASFMSDALISGFTMGAALHVLPSQLHSIFGLPFAQHVGVFKFPYECWNLFLQIQHTQWLTLTTSLAATVVLVAVREGINNNKKLFPRLPAPLPVELVLVVGATLVSKYLEFSSLHDVRVVGDIPRGLSVADVSVLRKVPFLWGKAIVIAVVVFALSFATAKILAEKHSSTVDANQELVALGMANVLGPLFSSFCCSVSLSRSMVQDDVGGRTQITSLISSSLVLVVLLFIGPLFRTVPNCVLAVIIVVSLKRLFLQCTLLPRFWRISKTDFAVWLVVFGATALLSVDLGLLVGITVSLFAVLFRTQTPYVCLLGQVEGTEMYADVNGRVKVSGWLEVIHM
ncbi:prestin-like [Babylonia areolata]|uniref:prestin-like n=1 Tax=Babylonia areolata TaxID=304850 RepID=UPI003FD08DF3